MPTNSTTPELLSEEQIAKIEAHLRRLKEAGEPWESKTEKEDTFKNVAARHALALCQTVRALQVRIEQLNTLGEEMLTRLEMVAGIGKKADHGWRFVVEEVERQHAALRDQLAQETKELTNRALRSYGTCKHKCQSLVSERFYCRY